MAVGKRTSPHKPGPGTSRRRRATAELWLWGSHTVEAALAHPARSTQRLVLTVDASKKRSALMVSAKGRGLAAETLAGPELSALLPAGAVHQGVALLARPLAPPDLGEACAPAGAGRSLVVVLDQVTDPRNFGAVLRAAAAFGARAVVVQDRNSPAESGVLAKAASGALDRVPVVRAANLSRALEALADLGYWRIALDVGANAALDGATEGAMVALVLGSEGAGLRRLTAEHCDAMARLATAPNASPANLNISVAAALALYEMRTRGPMPVGAGGGYSRRLRSGP